MSLMTERTARVLRNVFPFGEAAWEARWKLLRWTIAIVAAGYYFNWGMP